MKVVMRHGTLWSGPSMSDPASNWLPNSFHWPQEKAQSKLLYTKHQAGAEVQASAAQLKLTPTSRGPCPMKRTKRSGPI
jgi:hypothetical protein